MYDVKLHRDDASIQIDIHVVVMKSLEEKDEHKFAIVRKKAR